MTAPDDPSSPSGEPSAFAPPPAFGSPPPAQPTYGAPPTQGGAPPAYGAPPPAQPSYGAPPATYGAPPAYGAAPAYGAPGGGWAGPPLASWGSRVLATLVDAVIFSVSRFAVGSVNSALGSLVGLALEIYFIYLLGTTGQTPGKKLLKIKVLREADGQVLGFGMAFGRAIAHILDALPLFLGFLWPLWDAKNQTFADKVAHSVAIRA